MPDNRNGRRKNRLGREAVSQVDRHAQAMRLRAQGRSWGEIALLLGYSRGGAQRAVELGLNGSQLIPGLRHVFHKRLIVVHRHLDERDRHIKWHERDGFEEVLQATYFLEENLAGCLSPGGPPPGTRDVQGLLARRRPHDPPPNPRRDDFLRLRQMSATLPMMNGASGRRYANTSGVYKRLDIEVRRYLLTYATLLYDDEIDELRDTWHEIDLAVRRPALDTATLLDQLERLDALAYSMGLIAVTTLAGPNPKWVYASPGRPTRNAKYLRGAPYDPDEDRWGLDPR